jgi:hypothetical protein
MSSEHMEKLYTTLHAMRKEEREQEERISKVEK